MRHDPLANVNLIQTYWQTRTEALERMIREKAPALAHWLHKQDRAIMERADSVFPPAEDWRGTYLALIMLYRTLTPPKKLTGYGARKRRDWLNEPFLLLISSERICQRLHRLWRKGQLQTGINVLLSNHLPNVYRDIGVPRNRKPTKPDIERWAKARSVEAFAYMLLSHVRSMGVEHLKRVVSRMRSERQVGLKKFGIDVLPEDLREWRRSKHLSSPRKQPK